MSDVLQLMDRGFEQTGRIVGGITPDQFDRPTLCTEWDVRATLNHAVGTLVTFGTAARDGSAPEGTGQGDQLGSDPKAAYDRAARDALEAWKAPGALEGTLSMSFGEMPRPLAASITFLDVFVHGCDLAKATGQEARVDQDLCLQAADVARAMGIDGFRNPGVFGPEVAVDPDRPDIDRMLGFFGRQV